ncbi:uncharacterized protein LOC132178831 [Corylus avellana]|uniref:uncharacterized protein LOC132178831 n=1 Tax=Corylus avellana TaxID=13451 RepID=UPI00286A46C4|nr:uncharacterized protein LOC132178831 [Corylus avellana]
MHKLFQVSHGRLHSFLRNRFRDSRILSTSSLFHTPTKTPGPKSKLDFIVNQVEELQYSQPTKKITQPASETVDSSDVRCPTEAERTTVQISHPWPEWVDLMECLLKRGYIEGDGYPFRNSELGAKGSNHIRTACLNFARDRYDLIRFLSRKDIHVIARSGCPSIDRKVVNSGKRLRAHVGIDEGNVCSSCNLRGDCDRAYVKARQEEGGRTVDVMRILLTYALDPITGTLENKSLLNKLVKESVRRLLKEMVEYSTKELDSKLPKATPLKRVASAKDHSSPPGKGHLNVPMKQGDWLCPKCNFLNFAKNVKCLRCDGLFEERLRQLCEDQNHLPLKKGDWICDKCNFLNFAKNTRCLQCKEKPPKRQLNPGEWECDSCNYINFRKNMVCLKCNYRRPKASNTSDTSAQPRHDNGGYHNKSEVTDINDQPSVGQNRKSLYKDSNTWRFVEDSDDYARSRSRDEDSGFVDFPIAGGKSDLSQNAQRRERWKLEMQERSKGSIRARPEDDEFRSAHVPRTRHFPESADDDEMADWFGHGNTETNMHVQVPD